MSKIINLFGGPGIGKSSIASGLTYKLKKKHITCDNPYEFPKILAWDKNFSAISDQLYVLANQHRGIVKSYNKVDYIILDSPILLSLIYKDYYNKETTYPSSLYNKHFDNMILEMHNSYDNINILLTRNNQSNHNNNERYHNKKESKDLDLKIEKELNDNNIKFHKVEVGDNTVKKIYKIIKNN